MLLWKNLIICWVMKTSKTTLLPYIFPIQNNGQVDIKIFNPNEEEIWPELIRVFKHAKARKAFAFCAPELQIETLFHLSCKSALVQEITGSVYNLPLSIEMIRATNPDTLITQPKLATILLRKLAQKNIQSPFSTIFLFDKKTPETDSKFEDRHRETSFSYSKHPLYE